MAKQSGMGDNCYVGGYDLSGDVGSLSKISGSLAPLDVTAINKFAFERIGGLRDGGIDFSAFFNPSANQAHPVLSALPTSDVVVSYYRGTTLGNAAASLVAKQINYDGTRAADGGFTFALSSQANGFGLEWGDQVTAGVRTDTAATLGTAIDSGVVSTVFGAQAYLQAFAFTGTDATVKVQDSADNITFADVTGLTFTQITASRFTQRLATASGATLRRYVRAITITTGGFTSLAFAVQVTRNTTAVSF
jgi:hypothetical protein